MNLRVMKGCIVFSLALLGMTSGQTIATPAALLANGAAYNGKMVTVSGTVAGISRKVSKRGNAYVTFRLCEGERCVHVFEFGSPSIADGQTRTVTGIFSLEKHVGTAVYRDEIDVPR